MSSFVTAQPPSFDLQSLGDTNRESSGFVLNYITATPADASLLSPFQTHSNSASPSNFSTPAELASSDNGIYNEYGEFTDGDELYGVDFGAGDIPVPTIESLAAETYTDLIQPSEMESGLPYPLSPKNTSSPNGQSPKLHTTEAQAKMASSGHGSTLDINASGVLSANITNLQPTPDRSGSSQTSAEDLLSSALGHLGHSPRVTVTAYGSKGEQVIPTEPDNQEWYKDPFSKHQPLGQGQDANQVMDSGAEEDPSPAWDVEVSSRAGLDPESRKPLKDVKVPNFKDQEEQERLNLRSQAVGEWIWRTASAATIEGDGESWLRGTNSASSVHISMTRTNSRPQFQNVEYGPGYGINTEFDDLGEGEIGPVSDSESIRENKLKDGEIYYNLKGGPLTPVDMHLMQESRHWNDAPVMPYQTTNETQPPTSIDAIKKYNDLADNLSTFSRSATWGTRRRSEPSLADIDSVANGSFLKRLSLGKGRGGLSDRFRGSFDQIANMMKRANSNKLKRSGSDRESRGRQDSDHNQRELQPTLALPSRSPSCNRKRPTSPRVNTNLATSIPGSIPDRGRSLSATSPKNALTEIIGSVKRRARSKSDLQSGIAGLWSQTGGPPGPRLASQPLDSEALKQPEPSDIEGEEEEEEDLVDDGDKMEFDEEISIIPNFAGFQEHVLRLNPNMAPGYLVDRIAHQQGVRYKALLAWKVKHANSIVNNNCIANSHCMSLGGSVTHYDVKGAHRENTLSNVGLQNAGDVSDGDSNPEGALAQESFPPGVPMPPTQTLPAEFECQLCFRVKKFMKPSDWTKHVHEDVQPFTCTYANCREPKSFKRKADWVRHENERHRHLEWWTCQFDDCTHKCFRKDNFLQHLVREHKLPEPKQKTKAAVKKARGNDEQVWQMVRSCRHESFAKPQEEPCKFCGKTLTSWKKLTVHLAKHMEHISLPVLRIVEQQQVDANTIISPVEALPTRPTPLTPTADRRQSPNIQPIPQFRNNMYSSHTSPNVQPLEQFSRDQYSMSFGYRNVIGYASQTPVHRHGLGFESNFHYNFSQMEPQMATRQSQGYTPIDQSPNIDRAHAFPTANQTYGSSIDQQGYSYPNPSNSSQSLSPDPGTFVVGQQIPGFRQQTLGPDHGNFVAASQVPSFGSIAYQSSQGLGEDFGPVEMAGGSAGRTYPPTSNAPFGYHS